MWDAEMLFASKRAYSLLISMKIAFPCKAESRDRIPELLLLSAGFGSHHKVTLRLVRSNLQYASSRLPSYLAMSVLGSQSSDLM